LNLTIEQRAYMAGIIDGEGCLTLSKYIDQPRQKRKTVIECYRPFLTVETTSYALQQWLISVFKKGYVARNRHPYTNHKDRYLWCLSKKEDIFDVLVQIKPYLVIKKIHAEVMLDFLKEDLEHKNEHGYRQKHIEDYRAYREVFRKLNHRGRIENLANSEKPEMVTPSQTLGRDVCVETNGQEPKGMI